MRSKSVGCYNTASNQNFKIKRGSVIKGYYPSLFYSLSVNVDFVVAVAAVNGSAVCRLEWHFGALTALCADRGEHLAGRAVIAAATTGISLLLFSRRAAGRAALGLVGITLLREEFLLAGGESKRGTTIATNNGFVLKTHMDDLLLNIW